MRNKDKKMTSVMVDPESYKDFQIKALENNFSFQKLASRAIYLYINNKDFREQIHKHK